MSAAHGQKALALASAARGRLERLVQLEPRQLNWLHQAGLAALEEGLAAAQIWPFIPRRRPAAQAAITHLERLHQIEPTHARWARSLVRARLQRADQYLLKGELEQATEAYRQGLSGLEIWATMATPEGPQTLAGAWISLGAVAAKQRDWPLAEVALERGLELSESWQHPSALTALRLLARAKYELGQLQSAAQLWSEAGRRYLEQAATTGAPESDSGGAARLLLRRAGLRPSEPMSCVASRLKGKPREMPAFETQEIKPTWVSSFSNTAATWVSPSVGPAAPRSARCLGSALQANGNPRTEHCVPQRAVAMLANRNDMLDGRGDA